MFPMVTTMDRVQRDPRMTMASLRGQGQNPSSSCIEHPTLSDMTVSFLDAI